eukprot:4440683-Pyramimonas_sp.AAC.1
MLPGAWSVPGRSVPPFVSSSFFFLRKVIQSWAEILGMETMSIALRSGRSRCSPACSSGVATS